MRKLLPFVVITLVYSFFVYFWHKEALLYKFNPVIVDNYLRSQDIEDAEDKIDDRVFVSDSDIYVASGYLYTKGESPLKYNFQHPPLVKYLFGYSVLLTGNPFLVQILFGLILLFLTYFVGRKVFGSSAVGYLGAGLLLLDPVFGMMLNETLLDLGQTVFALAFLLSVFYAPGTKILQGVFLGLFAASKFWSTAVMFAVLVYAYKFLIKRKKNKRYRDFNHFPFSGAYFFTYLRIG